MKTDLWQILQTSRTCENFQQVAKDQGSEIIRDRVITFVDGKGVRGKGSGIGLSLQTIQKQIEKNNSLIQQKLSYL